MTSSEFFAQIKDIVNQMDILHADWINKQNKTAAAKMRKLSTALNQVCKNFRKESVAECKLINRRSRTTEPESETDSGETT